MIFINSQNIPKKLQVYRFGLFESLKGLSLKQLYKKVKKNYIIKIIIHDLLYPILYIFLKLFGIYRNDCSSKAEKLFKAYNCFIDLIKSPNFFLLFVDSTNLSPSDTSSTFI